MEIGYSTFLSYPYRLLRRVPWGVALVCRRTFTLTLLPLPVLYERIFEKERPTDVKQEEAGVVEHPAGALEESVRGSSCS